MKNKLKLMILKKGADRSHFGSNIESLSYPQNVDKKRVFFKPFPKI